jgi:ketosteroid isomerase-like protein
MAPHFPFANGREAIREIVQRLVADGSLAVTFEPARVDTARSGELGYCQGVYTLTITDPISKRPVTDKGSYLRIYRKEPTGGWRAAQEILTSSPTDIPVVPQ